MIKFDKEGETPLDDISGLRVEGITTRCELDEVEADNILEAFLKYTISASYPRKRSSDMNTSIP